ncbi:hypothetical protein DICSQDRAFT_142822 [Dichomitus squalens LYAD-421 SS1]|uniref:uncharacterized protein n=1 Tax=Dichomitus squalens (strain LYAD-421) TaxID=732165 RepID=UPI0004412CFA|nr:uncharacterized protein DICSQDRAFT_142822 [Dichomitus squalens LYAD-421 SS1]EJF67260.1 hypothetical protein DICSQDRAFT_142822 [Dichomitus squalens LYAD-421 SS1]
MPTCHPLAMACAPLQLIITTTVYLRLCSRGLGLSSLLVSISSPVFSYPLLLRPPFAPLICSSYAPSSPRSYNLS